MVILDGHLQPYLDLAQQQSIAYASSHTGGNSPHGVSPKSLGRAASSTSRWPVPSGRCTWGTASSAPRPERHAYGSWLRWAARIGDSTNAAAGYVRIPTNVNAVRVSVSRVGHVVPAEQQAEFEAAVPDVKLALGAVAAGGAALGPVLSGGGSRWNGATIEPAWLTGESEMHRLSTGCAGSRCRRASEIPVGEPRETTQGVWNTQKPPW